MDEEEAIAPAIRRGSNGVNGAAAAMAVSSIASNGRDATSSPADDRQNGSKASPNADRGSVSPPSSSDEDEFVEAQGGTATDGEDSSGDQASRRKGPLSRAAKIARDTMARDVKTRGKLGKPLASLSYEDVALSDDDIQEVRNRRPVDHLGADLSLSRSAF